MMSSRILYINILQVWIHVYSDIDRDVDKDIDIDVYVYAQSRSYFHSPGIFDSCETSLAR